MDPCEHPHLFYHHSQFLSQQIGPAPKPTIAAQFAYCSSPIYHDIQPPTFIAWVDDVTPRENDPEWEKKTDERLLWRGSNTGLHHNAGSRWRHAQRAGLVAWASDLEGSVNILMPTEGKVGNGTSLKRAIVNPALTDIAFAGVPVACDGDYCKYLGTQFEWRQKQNTNGKDAGNHKYIVDVGPSVLLILSDYLLMRIDHTR